MMRRAGTLPEPMLRSISKSYCSANCLEGQISIHLIPALPAHAPACLPGPAALERAATYKGVTGL
jgi:hypothetical protein